MNGKHLESACKAYAYRQAVKAERLAAEILASGKPLADHPKLAEFAALQRYLLDVGLAK